MAKLEASRRPQLVGVCGLLILVALLKTAYSHPASSSITASDTRAELSGSMRKLLHAGHVHEGDDPVDLRSSYLIANKGGAIAVFFVVPFIGVWIPLFLPINQEMLKYGLLFASGLFFTLAMEHLVSDAAYGFASLTSNEYPFAYMIVVAGYMMTWFTDLIVHAIWARKAERDERLMVPKMSSGEMTVKPSCCKKTVPTQDEEAALAKQCSGVDCKCNGDNCRCSASGLEYSEHQEMIRAGAAVEATVGGGKHMLNRLGVQELSYADLLLLVLAMCFHAVFEGLTVGLSVTAYQVWTFTWQIVLHKVFEGMALGAALKAQNKDRTWLAVAMYAAAFSIMAPVGIAIGIVLNTSVQSKAALWVNAIGNAFAAGVFIFVAISHLMVKGFRKGLGDRWWTPFLKWSVCALGVITTSLCQIPHSS